MFILASMGLALISSTPEAGLIESLSGSRFSRSAIIQDGQTLEAARGVWLAPARGWALVIDDQQITRWQVMDEICYPTRVGVANTPLMGQIEFRYITLSDDGQTADFQYLPGDGASVFTRIAALPASCEHPTGASPIEVFDAFTRAVGLYYPFFAEHDLDWPALVAAERESITPHTSEAELFTHLSTLLAPLDDSHTKLIATIEGERQRFQAGQGATLPAIRQGMGEQAWLIALVDQLLNEVLDEGAQQTANDRIIWGTIEERLGYIQIFTMGGFYEGEDAGSPQWAARELSEFDRHFDDILAHFNTLGVEAVILDLSNNRGGYDAIPRRIGSRFARAPFIGYKVDTDRDGHPDQVYDIDAHDGIRYEGPLYVLTSDVTVSAGEITTLILRNLDQVHHVGQTTRGSFSTPLAKPLPNGWYLEVSSEVFTDPQGVSYEVSGIPPQDPFVVFDVNGLSGPVESHEDALRRLTQSILQGD